MKKFSTYRKMSDAELDTSDQYVDTNILGVDNRAAEVVQDIVVTTAVTGVAESVAFGTLWKMGGKQIARGLEAKMSQKMATRLSKANFSHLRKLMMDRIRKLMSRGLQKAGAKAGTAVAAKVGTRVATAGARAGSGCTAGPVGCAAGAVYFVADMAFTIFSTIMDMTDEEGLLVLLNRAYIDELTEDFHEMYEAGLKDAFDESAVPDSEDRALEYMNEEKTFDPINFLFDYNENTKSYEINLEWATRFVELEDEYMASIGITGDWRKRMDDALQIGDNLSIPDIKKKGTSNLVVSMSSVSSSCLFFMIILLLLM
jgi:hypothetical protein